MEEVRISRYKIQSAIDQILEKNNSRAEVADVDVPKDKSCSTTVFIRGDIFLNELNDIGRAFGDDSILVAAGDSSDEIALYLCPSRDPDLNNLTEADDDECDWGEQKTPCIPADIRHVGRFPDSEDIIIPGTKCNVSNTEMCQQIVDWMKETGHTPIVFIRLEDGVHAEVSKVYDLRIKDMLTRGKAIGADARRYTFDKSSFPYPIGGSICVRVTCDETGRSDMYSLEFFV